MNKDKYFEVPQGNIYSEDVGEILRPLDIIPRDCNPAKVRNEPSEVIEIYPGENPFDIVEQRVKMGKVWVILHEEVLESARKIPDKFHCITPVLGEIFTFGAQNFRNPKIVYLNEIEGFGDWKIIQAWQGKDDKKFVRTPVNPEKIITVVMKKN